MFTTWFSNRNVLILSSKCTEKLRGNWHLYLDTFFKSSSAELDLKNVPNINIQKSLGGNWHVYTHFSNSGNFRNGLVLILILSSSLFFHTTGNWNNFSESSPGNYAQKQQIQGRSSLRKAERERLLDYSRVEELAACYFLDYTNILIGWVFLFRVVYNHPPCNSNQLISKPCIISKKKKKSENIFIFPQRRKKPGEKLVNRLRVQKICKGSGPNQKWHLQIRKHCKPTGKSLNKLAPALDFLKWSAEESKRGPLYIMLTLFRAVLHLYVVRIMIPYWETYFRRAMRRRRFFCSRMSNYHQVFPSCKENKKQIDDDAPIVGHKHARATEAIYSKCM